jgi:hypothetical protein
MSLLSPQRIEVQTERALVVLKLGNVEVKMDYDTALKLSTWLRFNGKEAKRNAGDVSRHWTVVGRLSDVEAGERPF